MGFQTKSKQIFISAIYLTIFLLIVAWIYLAFRPVPNCFDGKLNQNEKGVDCGGVCAKKCELVAEQNIQVLKKGFVESGLVNKYDLYAEIVNPNNLLGSNEFEYDFILKDSTGKVLAQKNGKEFILPGEKKYIIELNIETVEKPSQMDFNFTNVKWTEFESYQKPQLTLVNKVYNEIASGVGFSEGKGLLKNESQFDFSTIRVQVILKDSAGEVLALNLTSMNAVKAGENRDFQAFWPNRFPGDVKNMEIITEVNVFDSESFLKRYYPTDRFQELE